MASSPLPGIEQLYEQAPCGLLVAGAQGQLLHANATLCGWLQLPAAELVGQRRFQDLLTMGGRIFYQTHLAPLLRMQGSVAEVKLEIRRGDGSTLPMIVNMRELAWAGQPLLHVSALIAEDRHKYERELLLQRQRAEAMAAQHAADQVALAQARSEAEDRALFAEQLVGVVSHDIRNPLAVIDLSTVLLRKLEPSAQQLAVVDRMTRSVGRVQHLIVDLLDFTQARLGRGLAIQLADTDLHACVAEAVAELGHAFPSHAIRHHASGDGRALADGQRIIQAVGNLVANAANHGAADGPITVHTEPGNACFRIRVHNEGPPIPPQTLPALFHPMVRGAQQQPAQGGVGLGLYIVDRIVQGHGGSIQVDSDARTGTSFTLVLPGATFRTPARA